MESLYKPVKAYIESKKYFADAKNWYKYKYLQPFSHRSILIILNIISLVLLLTIIMNINAMFPLVNSIRYSTVSGFAENKSAQIIKADQIRNDPLASITEIMIKNYIKKRESYDYNNLENQFTYIKNSSTRMIFRRFYNYININNPNSPILLYQKNIKRSCSFISSQFLSKTKSEVKFRSIAKNNMGKIFENKIWRVIVDYEIDPINISLPHGTRYNFTVTNYQLTLLEDKLKK